MNLHKKKYLFNIFTFGFLFYFIIYAISPLSYNFTAKKVFRNISVSDNPHCLSDNINIFFWELICKYLVPKSNDNQSNSTDRILFKKARAILPEDITARIVHAEDISLDRSFPVLPASPPSGFAFLADTTAPLQDYNPLYSGLSPPSA
jgi:hypothetical protein